MAERGRPRSFDREAALHEAMIVFWKRGYQGSSMADLTAVMGINATSLYAAYGSKERLFREAVQLYGHRYGAITDRALAEQPTTRAAIEAMLRENAVAYTDQGTPRGCMVMLSAPVRTQENAGAHDFLVEIRRTVLRNIENRLRQGVTDGELPESTNTTAVADYYFTVLQGLSFRARDGGSCAELQAVIDYAMATWDQVLVKPILSGGDRPNR